MHQPQKSHEQNILPKHLQMDELIFVPYTMHAMNYCFCVFRRGNWKLTSTTYQDHRENILSVVYQRWKVLVVALEAENKISDILPQNPHQTLEDSMPLSTYLSLLLQPLILEHLSLRKVKKKKHSRFHSFTKLPQERTMGQDRKRLVYPLGYVNFTQVNRSSFLGQSANFYLACEQSLHLGYIVKSRRVRGDAKARGGGGGGGGLAPSPPTRVFSCGSLRSPK